jgi:hypothetical protein
MCNDGIVMKDDATLPISSIQLDQIRDWINERSDAALATGVV